MKKPSFSFYGATQKTKDGIKKAGRGAKAVVVNKATKKAGHGVKVAVVNKATKAATRGVGHGIHAATVNKATKPVGRGAVKAFSWASGNKAMHDRGLERGEGGGTFASILTGAELAWMAPTATAVILAPVIGPFAIPAAVAAAAAGGMGPAQIQARYRISKDKHEIKKAKAQAARLG